MADGLDVFLVHAARMPRFPDGVALPFAPPIPVRELNLLRNPMRLEGKAGVAFREEVATAFQSDGSSSPRTKDSKQELESP